jgi:hypothetical protein
VTEGGKVVKAESVAVRCRCLWCAEYYASLGKEPPDKHKYTTADGGTVYDTTDLTSHTRIQT